MFMSKTCCHGQMITFLVCSLISLHACFTWEAHQDLPDDHRKYFISNFNQKFCRTKKNGEICNSLKDHQDQKYCWGYEKNCLPGKDFHYPKCFQHHHGWAKDLKSQEKLFWEQGDFGYIKKKLDNLQYVCKPKKKDKNFKSFLRCNDKWEYCRGRNIFLDVSKKEFQRERFQKNFFLSGEIGGFCTTAEDLNKRYVQLSGELNSWKSDLDNITEMSTDVFEDRKNCDIFIEKPVIFMKLDSGVNLFHHFCDFFNLYASQHMNGSFTKDVYLYNWDTSFMPYGDIFKDSWNAFTNYPLKYLKEFVGKRVCLKDVVFSLPPRMIYGLYYNTPLVPSCEGSSLFRAFSHHFLHRMSIPSYQFKKGTIRVTFIKRNTKYRQVLNLNELMTAARKIDRLHVEAIDYNRDIPFTEQLEISQHTDILIGIHGAGLTHLLFQPDWGAVIELYNTGDADCYKDLARLRGLKYLTWRDKSKLFPEDEGHHPTLGPHEKFTNYLFDIEEFVIILNEAISAVIEGRVAKEKESKNNIFRA